MASAQDLLLSVLCCSTSLNIALLVRGIHPLAPALIHVLSEHTSIEKKGGIKKYCRSCSPTQRGRSREEWV